MSPAVELQERRLGIRSKNKPGDAADIFHCILTNVKQRLKL